MKPLFVSSFLAFESVATGVAVAFLARGGGLAWAGVLGTSAPLLVLLGWAYATRSLARTSAGLPVVTAAAVSGVALSLFASDGADGGTSRILAGVGLLGTLTYVFWYSKLDRKETPLLRRGLPLPFFEATDESGTPFSSTTLLGRPAVILFYRGNWCPFCVAQVGELAAAWRELERRGAQVVLVSPQPASHTRALAERLGVPMRFVVDDESRIGRALGIVHEGGLPAGLQVLGYDSDTVLPTAIVTDAEGRILLADATDNYRVRPEPATFIAVLDAATKASHSSTGAGGIAST